MRFHRIGGAVAGIIMLWSAAAAAAEHHRGADHQRPAGRAGGDGGGRPQRADGRGQRQCRQGGEGAAELGPARQPHPARRRHRVRVQLDRHRAELVPHARRHRRRAPPSAARPLQVPRRRPHRCHRQGGVQPQTQPGAVQAIREALVTTFTVAPKRLFAVGVGEELPLDAGNPDAAINRRVQLVNIGETR